MIDAKHYPSIRMQEGAHAGQQCIHSYSCCASFALSARLPITPKLWYFWISRSPQMLSPYWWLCIECAPPELAHRSGERRGFKVARSSELRLASAREESKMEKLLVTTKKFWIDLVGSACP